MQEQRHKDTKHPEKAQRMDYPSRNNPGSQSLPLINKYSSSNNLSFCLYALFARRTNVSPLVYGNNIFNIFLHKSICSKNGEYCYCSIKNCHLEAFDKIGI
ncbi:hypothetical protein EDEG_03128 [Edhazardia aedis USNM 41457]|uniref:Uncharacterized protein n=1 Tax=Edhazardia aedis (strain USNM 41457) TaxID=1003232 RepID=J9DIL6_EDHAE|nr:hypothetical protein EDEG_03128 [Edhazardia aedis USNM 41457]|eukprot:EJW02455.1 hypothetical protein EDEG_03128 [Edhazardia aedis USNM 41457]